jgi:hypothetical protein
MRLKKRLSAKGNRTKNGMRPFKKRYATRPYDTAMMRYKTDHTGPKSHEGGAHDGLTRVEYHERVSILVSAMTKLFVFGILVCIFLSSVDASIYMVSRSVDRS